MQIITEYRQRYDYEMSQREQNEIWQMLCNTDNEFVPSLSSRESTTQHNFSDSTRNATPIKYFESLKTQEWIVAKTENRVVGFLSFYRTGGNTIYISTIVVDPWHRNKGICTKLYIAIQDQNGWECLRTRTWSTNNIHIHILNKLGFCRTRVIQDDRGPGVNTLYFEKNRELK